MKMNINIKKCVFCGEEISEFKRKDSKFCNSVCRGRNFEKLNPNRKAINKDKKINSNHVLGVGNSEKVGVEQ